MAKSRVSALAVAVPVAAKEDILYIMTTANIGEAAALAYWSEWLTARIAAYFALVDKRYAAPVPQLCREAYATTGLLPDATAIQETVEQWKATKKAVVQAKVRSMPNRHERRKKIALQKRPRPEAGLTGVPRH